MFSMKVTFLTEGNRTEKTINGMSFSRFEFTKEYNFNNYIVIDNIKLNDQAPLCDPVNLGFEVGRRLSLKLHHIVSPDGVKDVNGKDVQLVADENKGPRILLEYDGRIVKVEKGSPELYYRVWISTEFDNYSNTMMQVFPYDNDDSQGGSGNDQQDQDAQKRVSRVLIEKNKIYTDNVNAFKTTFFPIVNSSTALMGNGDTKNISYDMAAKYGFSIYDTQRPKSQPEKEKPDSAVEVKRFGNKGDLGNSKPDQYPISDGDEGLNSLLSVEQVRQAAYDRPVYDASMSINPKKFYNDYFASKKNDSNDDNYGSVSTMLSDLNNNVNPDDLANNTALPTFADPYEFVEDADDAKMRVLGRKDQKIFERSEYEFTLDSTPEISLTSVEKKKEKEKKEKPKKGEETKISTDSWKKKLDKDVGDGIGIANLGCAVCRSSYPQGGRTGNGGQTLACQIYATKKLFTYIDDLGPAFPIETDPTGANTKMVKVLNEMAIIIGKANDLSEDEIFRPEQIVESWRPTYKFHVVKLIGRPLGEVKHLGKTKYVAVPKTAKIPSSFEKQSNPKRSDVYDVPYSGTSGPFYRRVAPNGENRKMTWAASSFWSVHQRHGTIPSCHYVNDRFLVDKQAGEMYEDLGLCRSEKDPSVWSINDCDWGMSNDDPRTFATALKEYWYGRSKVPGYYIVGTYNSIEAANKAKKNTKEWQTDNVRYVVLVEDGPMVPDKVVPGKTEEFSYSIAEILDKTFHFGTLMRKGWLCSADCLGARAQTFAARDSFHSPFGQSPTAAFCNNMGMDACDITVGGCSIFAGQRGSLATTNPIGKYQGVYNVYVDKGKAKDSKEREVDLYGMLFWQNSSVILYDSIYDDGIREYIPYRIYESTSGLDSLMRRMRCIDWEARYHNNCVLISRGEKPRYYYISCRPESIVFADPHKPGAPIFNLKTAVPSPTRLADQDIPQSNYANYSTIGKAGALYAHAHLNVLDWLANDSYEIALPMRGGGTNQKGMKLTMLAPVTYSDSDYFNRSVYKLKNIKYTNDYNSDLYGGRDAIFNNTYNGDVPTRNPFGTYEERHNDKYVAPSVDDFRSALDPTGPAVEDAGDGYSKRSHHISLKYVNNDPYKWGTRTGREAFYHEKISPGIFDLLLKEKMINPYISKYTRLDMIKKPENLTPKKIPTELKEEKFIEPDLRAPELQTFFDKYPLDYITFFNRTGETLPSDDTDYIIKKISTIISNTQEDRDKRKNKLEARVLRRNHELGGNLTKVVFNQNVLSTDNKTRNVYSDFDGVTINLTVVPCGDKIEKFIVSGSKMGVGEYENK